MKPKANSKSHRPVTPNEAWKTVTMTCKETVKTIFGVKEPNNKPSTYKELQILSSKQKKLRDEIDPPTTKTEENNLKMKKIRPWK